MRVLFAIKSNGSLDIWLQNYFMKLTISHSLNPRLWLPAMNYLFKNTQNTPCATVLVHARASVSLPRPGVTMTTSSPHVCRENKRAGAAVANDGCAV